MSLPPELLLFVFATHGPFFAWRYYKTRERRHAATTLTFALLIATYSLKVFAPEARLGGAPLHGIVRVPALLAAAISLSLLSHHLIGKLRARMG